MQRHRHAAAVFIRRALFDRLCVARHALVAVDGEDAPAISALATQAQLSTPRFIAQFSALFGSTPHHLRQQARLERASALLLDGERSVTEVCMEVGFSSLGSFSALFARRYGTSPSLYRRSQRLSLQVPRRRLALVPGCFGLLGQLPADAFTRRGISEKQTAPTTTTLPTPPQKEPPCASS